MNLEELSASTQAPWRRRAACNDLPSERTVGPEEESTRQRRLREKVIIGNYCLRCPVVRQCLEDALRMEEEYGVKGATAGKDREKYFNGEMTREELEVSGIRRVYGEEAARITAEGLARMRQARKSAAEAIATIPAQPTAPVMEMPPEPAAMEQGFTETAA